MSTSPRGQRFLDGLTTGYVSAPVDLAQHLRAQFQPHVLLAVLHAARHHAFLTLHGPVNTDDPPSARLLKETLRCVGIRTSCGTLPMGEGVPGHDRHYERHGLAFDYVGITKTTARNSLGEVEEASITYAQGNLFVVERFLTGMSTQDLHTFTEYAAVHAFGDAVFEPCGPLNHLCATLLELAVVQREGKLSWYAQLLATRYQKKFRDVLNMLGVTRNLLSEPNLALERYNMPSTAETAISLVNDSLHTLKHIANVWRDIAATIPTTSRAEPQRVKLMGFLLLPMSEAVAFYQKQQTPQYYPGPRPFDVDDADERCRTVVRQLIDGSISLPEVFLALIEICVVKDLRFAAQAAYDFFEIPSRAPLFARRFCDRLVLASYLLGQSQLAGRTERDDWLRVAMQGIRTLLQQNGRSIPKIFTASLTCQAILAHLYREPTDWAIAASPALQY